MSPETLWNQLSSFTTVFLGIFMEAAPFLLLGTIASGLIEVFVSQDTLARFFPSRLIPATITGSLLGFIFPVCDCGVVPLTQRLYKKGLPTSAGIAFLLAAPIVNPIVIASTYSAYGFGRVLLTRLILGVVISFSVGLIFSLNKSPASLMRAPASLTNVHLDLAVSDLAPNLSFLTRLKTAFRISGNEFFNMGRYLVIGSLLAALVQTVIPPSLIIAAGSGPLSSVIVMQGLAFVLSVCSTVDAFISLTFVKLFSTGSILSFLVFGPMIDIKSTMMFLGVMRPKMVFYLILLTFLLVTLTTLFLNNVLGW
jgi:uncharacterized membrane protein YraQ (UPF0718 family)